MRVPRLILSLAMLTLASACGQGVNSAARPNTMIDTKAHESFFPIAAGSKHALGSDSPAITCNSCHGGSNSFKQFDCLSCHQHQDQATLTAGHRGVSQFAYDSASCYSCHRNGAAGGAVPAGAISDPAKSLTINAEIPSYVDTSISSLSPQTETLPMPMYHASPNVVAASLTSCGNCHVNAGMGAFFPGDLHLSLASLSLAQPTACADCHASSMPIGFVGPTATNPARSPASSEMKHDAVLWSKGLPTKASAVPQDCAVCHVTPTMTMSATWATSRAGTTPARFHVSLTAAPLPQPNSCVDCHANSRPAVPLTSANAALPANVQFDHSVAEALGDCTSCHLNGGATQWSSWSGGQFHLAGSATPTSCLPCHASERPTSTSTWVSTTYKNSPFDDVPNTLGIGHGAGQDCVTCHAGPGTGTWGGTPKQNWAGGYFLHGAGTTSATTCFQCHTTQRPDLVYGAAAASALPGSFDHSVNGTGDCFGCHQATVKANPSSYVTYWDGRSANTSDWKGGLGYPGSTLISAPSQFISVTETTLNHPPGAKLVTSTSSITATLYNAMLHTSLQVPPSLRPTKDTDYPTCSKCHAGIDSTGKPIGPNPGLQNGQFHSALTANSLPQPTSNCFDCHAQMRPTGIVQLAGSDLQPMDHNATFVSGSNVNQIDCSTCHSHAGSTTPGWADGRFHTNIGAAVPADCTTCHYPLMADAAKSDLSSGVNYAMKHTSSQLTFQNCQLCHATALSRGASTPDVSTLWQPGAFHASLAPQPTACLTCHAISEPAAKASTQSSVNYNLPLGGTSTNAAQWMNHGSGFATGKDCVTCHAADAKASGAAWSKSDSFHGVVSNPGSCKECHGLTNGGGSTAGTNNNLPVGLTNSSTVTSAAADNTTGVPSGTLDQITHADINISGHDCNFCHTQKGVSTASGVQGKEWAQAAFHANFTSTNPLLMNGNTGRCSDCHMNVKPGAGFAAFDHTAFTATPGSQDCSSCHSWPGTGTPTPNWLGASAAPALVTLTNWGYGSPTTHTVTFAHPSPSTYTSCAQCHAGSSFSTIIDFNHDGLTRNVTVDGVPATPNLGTSQYNISTNPTFCVACHSSNSQWVSRGVSSTIIADTTSGSTTVTTGSTSALTLGMTISGTGIPINTTITAIPSATSITVSTAANATTTGTTLTVTHMSIRQATIGSHNGSTNGEECTSCHYVGGRDHLTPPTPGVFGTGSISGN